MLVQVNTELVENTTYGFIFASFHLHVRLMKIVSVRPLETRAFIIVGTLSWMKTKAHPPFCLETSVASIVRLTIGHWPESGTPDNSSGAAPPKKGLARLLLDLKCLEDSGTNASSVGQRN